MPSMNALRVDHMLYPQIMNDLIRAQAVIVLSLGELEFGRDLVNREAILQLVAVAGNS